MTPEELRILQLEQLKEVAKIFLKPMERLPFPVVIEAMTGKEVFPVMNRQEDIILLEKLAQACIQTIIETQKLRSLPIVRMMSARWLKQFWNNRATTSDCVWNVLSRRRDALPAVIPTGLFGTMMNQLIWK